MKKYAIHGGIGFGLSVLLALARFSDGEGGVVNIMRAASDGFTVVGFFYLAFACLEKVAATGFFDIFSYGVREGVSLILPGLAKESTKYYDYKTQKQEKRVQKEKREGKYAVLITGAALLVLGVVFTGLYYVVG